ncbi:MAG: deoxyribonuclease IV [Verrucomicrobia bacterium]|nr:deoxyribonuclease IV [Verrucomicrobiota bacterium]
MKPCSKEDCTLYHEEPARRPMACVFGHTGDLNTLGAPPSPNRQKSIPSLIHEIGRADALALPFLMIHPNAHPVHGEEVALANIVAGLDTDFGATAGSRVRITLENTAGQGSFPGYRIGHPAALIGQGRSPDRPGICLETARFFAASHDGRTEAGWEAAVHEVESSLGLKRLLGFPLKNSKKPLGSRIDRHEHIGQGSPGREAFRRMVDDPRFATTPGCLETPKPEDSHADRKNLALWRSLAADCYPKLGKV